MWPAPVVRPTTVLSTFKAGKMTATPSGNKFRVEADARKGTVSLLQGNDGTLHFAWKDRTTMQVELDLLMSPGDQKFVKVDTGRPDDRVYLLTFESAASVRHFFWMQEPDASKDEERVKKFNDIMNSRQGQSRAGAGGFGGGNLNPLLGTNASPLASSSSQPAVGLDELSDILSGLGYGGGGDASSTAAVASASAPSAGSEQSPMEDVEDESEARRETSSDDAAKGETQQPKEETASADQMMLTEEDLIRALEGPTLTPNLARVVTSDTLQQMIDESDEETRQVLLAFLPEGKQTMEELRLTIRSPQLRQTLVQLSRALNSENIGLVIASFGLDASAAMNLLQIGDGIGAFLAALEDQVEREERDKKSSSS